MENAGFGDVEYTGATGITTSRFTAGALFRGRKSTGSKL
jgi:hypothetical protein